MTRHLFAAIVLIALAASMPSVQAGDWLQWRGPKGTGQSDEKGLPLTWSQTENVKWKVKLDGPGNSSPIVVGQKVFITHAPADSKLRGIQCYDRNTGELLWKHQVTYAEPELTHNTNPYCAASPVSDGERVVAFYGSAGVYGYDLAGKVLWQKDLGKIEHIWGFGSSPIIYQNLVIHNFGPGLNAFVVALDKQTGSEVWRKTFPGQASEKVDEYRGSWTTPVVHREGDRDVLLLALPETLWAVDPKTGDEIWSCGGLSNKLVYGSPIIAGDIIVTMCGYGGPAMAVRSGGKGDVTQTHRLWHQETPKPPQRVGTGVVVGDHVYLLNSNGAAWCLDPATGEKKWDERLGGESWCSMVHVDGKIYISNKAGTTYVVEPNPTALKVLAENKQGELIRASPAFSNGQIFIRTYDNLYCIEAK
jgi:outer membrane protein assembly factor BamB